jgi:hypothetical protein
MKAFFQWSGLLGFALAAAAAIIQRWSLPEFCWSTWLAGLVYSWACILTAAVRIVLTARTEKPAYEERLRFLRTVPPSAFLLGMAAGTAAVGYLAFHLYNLVFSFYGLFLSVFAGMEPASLFGRDGFINSDFWTPVGNLLARYWPMAAGILILSLEDFLGGHPWERIILPLQRQVLRMHVMILALPFLSLIAWAILGDAYPTAAVVLLMAVMYLLPRKGRGEAPPLG